MHLPGVRNGISVAARPTPRASFTRKMCETTSSINFKGVVIVQLLLNVLATSSANPVQQTYTTTVPYCVYLDKSQEMRCGCNEEGHQQEKARGGQDKKPLVFPTDSFLTSTSVQQINGQQHHQDVASIKVHSCQSLYLSLDLRPLPSPFYRLRFEDVKSVRIDGIIVRPNDTVDIWFNGVNDSLDVSGLIECPECRKRQVEVVNGTAASKLVRPQVKLHIVDSGNVTFDNFVVDSDVDLSLKMRQDESLLIQDSYFTNMSPNSVEIFNVPKVDFVHSEFHRSSPSCMVFNGNVNNITVADCLMETNTIHLLSQESTDIKWKCTVSPTNFIQQDLDLDPDCQTIGRWTSSGGNVPHPGVESTGAVVLAVVSALILLIVVGLLFFLHKQGKLDQYL